MDLATTTTVRRRWTVLLARRSIADGGALPLKRRFVGRGVAVGRSHDGFGIGGSVAVTAAGYLIYPIRWIL